MPDAETKAQLERDAEGEDRSAGVADYVAVLADGEGNTEKGDVVRDEARVLRNWAALNRTIEQEQRLHELLVLPQSVPLDATNSAGFKSPATVTSSIKGAV